MKVLFKDEVFKKAHNEYKKFTADERLRDLQERRIKWRRDKKACWMMQEKKV